MFEIANSTVTELAACVSPVRDVLKDIQSHVLRDDRITQAHKWLAEYLTQATMTGASRRVYESFTWSAVLIVLLVFLVAANFKNFPLIYHLRILNGVRFLLKSQRPPQPMQPEQLFKPLITSSRATLMETDVFGHKSNSTYFSDVDVARVHLLTTLFSKAIEKIRGGTTMNGMSGKASSAFTIPLGGVTCSFRRELKPYEKYDMWTRILSWDEKWFYIVTHFVKAGAKIEPQEYSLYPRQNSITSSSSPSRQGSITSLETPRGSIAGQTSADVPNSAIAASAMSKIVFKNGRITIAPEVMLEAAGLLPAKPTETTAEHNDDLGRAQVLANTSDVGPKEAVSQVEKVEGSDLSSQSSQGSADGLQQEYTREIIEVERQRGMRLARTLKDQTGLEHEFTDQVALGRHHDGYGIEGVVATLAQLANADANANANALVSEIDGTILFNNSKVTLSNVLTAKGVIHVIDRVLNPNNISASPGEEAFFEVSSATTVPFTNGVPTPKSSIMTSGYLSASSSAPSVDTNSNSGPGSKTSVHVGAIAGGIVVGILYITVTGFLICFVRRESSREGLKSDGRMNGGGGGGGVCRKDTGISYHELELEATNNSNPKPELEAGTCVPSKSPNTIIASIVTEKDTPVPQDPTELSGRATQQDAAEVTALPVQVESRTLNEQEDMQRPNQQDAQEARLAELANRRRLAEFAYQRRMAELEHEQRMAELEISAARLRSQNRTVSELEARANPGLGSGD